jgi:hypothetical protein
MTNIFTVKLLKNGQLIQQRQVHTGLAESTGAVRIKAQADTVYVLSSESSKKSVSKIVTKRVGNDLQMVLDESTTGKPQLVIEGYFEPNQNSALATQGSEGELVLFSTEAQSSTQTLAEPNSAVVQTAKGVNVAWWKSTGAQLALIGGGIALVSSSKSKSSTSETSQSAEDTITTYAAAADPARVTTPTLANYADAGIKGVDTSNLDAINSAITINRARVKDLAGVQTVLTAYQKLFTKANGSAADNTTDDPTLADYQALGIKLSKETIDNQFHQIDLLNDIIKNRISTDINNVTKIDAFASIADRIMLNAKGNTPSTQLSTAELKSIGLTDVTDANLPSIISAIAASADDGTGVKSISRLISIQAAYIKVLNQADGVKLNTTDTTKIPTATELQALGVILGKAGTPTDKQQVNALKLLNEVIDGVNNAAVDTVAELNALASTIDKLMDVAISSDSTKATSLGLGASAITSLGITGVTTDSLAQVVEAIRLTQSIDAQKINSIKQLQSVVDLGIIMTYADSSPNSNSVSVAPSLTQYLSAGLLSTDETVNKAITANNLNAINSAVNALTATQVNSVANLQKVVDAYSKILKQADGNKNLSLDTSLVPTVADYKAIGVSLGKAETDPNSLTLLNEVLGGINTFAVDTISEINAFTTTIDKVASIVTATDAAQATSVGLTSTDLSPLGITGVTADNLAQVVNAIRLTSGVPAQKIQGVTSLQSAVDLGVIMNYAETANNSTAHIAPTLTQYHSAGLLMNSTELNKSISTSNVGAINSAVEALKASDVNSLTKLQAIVNTYGKLAEAADGTKGNYRAAAFSIDDYKRLGALNLFDNVSGEAGAGTFTSKALGTTNQGVAALNLLNDVIDGLSFNAINSVAEINLISQAVDKVLDQTQDVPPSTLKVEDFTLLGINGVNKDNISKVLENLNITGKTNAAGTTIDSLVEIQAQVSLAQAQLYANSTSNPALTLQNYQDFNFSGIDWGTSGLVSAVNTVIESKIATDIPKLDDVKKISLSFQSILKKATIGVINSNTDPTIDDYETVTGSKLHLFSVNDITNDKLDDNALLLMNDIVRRKTPDQLNSQLEVDTLATQVDRLMKLASNKSTILFSDLSSMGFTIPSSWSDSNTPSKINKFSELVIAGADSGEAINTWDKVQNIINSQAVISA